MAARDHEPELFDPKKLFWIVGPTYDLGSKEFKVVWDDLIIKQKFGLDKRVKKSFSLRQGDMFIELPWGTRIEVRSAQHPETLVGEGLSGVIMSEAAKHSEETWNRYIRPALADKRGWADFPSTPEGLNWYHKLWQLGQDPDFAEYESWNFPSWENPYVYPGGINDPEILLLKRTMSEEEFLQEIAASFAAFVGKIYDEFDEVTHVKRHEFRPDWPNYITFDWGFANPLAAIEFQVSPWDEVFVWREHYKSYMRLEQHIETLKAREQPPGYHLDLAFGDAADPEAAQYVSEHLVGCIADPLSKKNWRQGINKVKEFLKMREVGVADEFGTPKMAPGLFVDPRCKNVIHEFNTYKVKDNVAGTTAESRASGVASKDPDHAMDALRYGIMHVFELGARYHLSDVVGVSAGRNEYDSVLDFGVGESIFTEGISY